jgi:predicted TIM-barrel fold metal-dependent hydrolase
MTIIDFHIHIGLREHWHPWVNEYLEKINPDLYSRFDDIMNPNGFVNYLKSHGVDRAVILAEESPITTGVVTNEFVYEFCKDQKMFIPFASIDPTRAGFDNAPDELEEYVTKMGFKGLKLYPTYQHYYPNQKELYPVYEKVTELKIPLMLHTGSSIFKGAKLKFGDPIFIDDIAVDFPEMTIVMAHSGRGHWYDHAFTMANLHKNVYMEIAGLPPKNLIKYFPDLEKLPDKIIFGSDWPGVPSISGNIDTINNLSISDSTKEKILGSNAMRILKI